ncbi:hypothetical protein GG681_02125 [Epibacterium sp. SM1969]|uniref:Uncharacterized protein n=1 Tax=Tritonibacter aquimaris TaxID=2663379 RepID=A0A844AJY9_9RHOB|nr:hypothetical protein [Tritonibacter aquimaris]MQY41425.1 hypothetical protein [Tritonibacter aquimaris]
MSIVALTLNAIKSVVAAPRAEQRPAIWRLSNDDEDLSKLQRDTAAHSLRRM